MKFCLVSKSKSWCAVLVGGGRNMSGLINWSESSQLEFEESLLLLLRMFKLRLLSPSSLGECGSSGVARVESAAGGADGLIRRELLNMAAWF